LTRHTFSPEDYKKFDSPGKTALSKFLTHNGYEVLEKAEDYDVDLVSTLPLLNNRKFIHELETCSWWTEGRFTSHYDEIRIPGRKERLLLKYKDEDLDFIIWYLSSTYHAGYYINARDVSCLHRQMRRAKQWNGKYQKYCWGDEPFYCIPMSLWTYTDLVVPEKGN
jgi:hypothetical protein